MKTTLFVFALAATVALVACDKDEVKQPETPTTVVGVPAPTTTVAPGAVDKEQEFCKADGAKFNCGNPVWYGFKGCKPDSDGDGGAEGTMYMKSLADIEAMVKVHDAGVNVKMKDGSVKHFGQIGFVPDCVEL